MNISLRALLTLSSLQISCGEISSSLPFTTIEIGNYSGIKDEYQDIFRTKMELESFWSKHKSNSFPTPPAPDALSRYPPCIPQPPEGGPPQKTQRPGPGPGPGPTA